MGTGTFAEPTFEALLVGAGPRRRPGHAARPRRRATSAAARARPARAWRPSPAQRRPGLPAREHQHPGGRRQLRGVAPGPARRRRLRTDPLEGRARAARSAAINVHASLLPKYRGAAPVACAILNGETRTGVTIIRRSPGLDAGDMLAPGGHRHPAPTRRPASSRPARPLGARLAVDAVARCRPAAGEGVKQDPAPGDEGPEAQEGVRPDRLDAAADYIVLPGPGDAAVADGVHVPAPAGQGADAGDRQHRAAPGDVIVRSTGPRLRHPVMLRRGSWSGSGGTARGHQQSVSSSSWNSSPPGRSG